MRRAGFVLALPVALFVLGGLAACNNGIFYTALGNKIQVPTLTILPAMATVPANGTTTFSASGGVPPYVFSIISGPGSIVSSTGLYTAPATPGVATVQVKDRQGSTAKAVVNPVTYAVTAVSNPGAQFSGGTASGTFTIANVGSSNGAQTISWTVYASPNPTPGTGSSVVESQTTPALASGASTTISFSGTWPTPSTPTSYYLIAAISSADSSGASLASTSFTLAPAQVDYAVTAVTYTPGSTVPGGAVSGTFQMKNNGPNSGIQNVSWQVYASTTTTLSATPAPVLVASGTTGPLSSGASSPSPISFSGAWPLTYGNYYLVASVSVQVDQDTKPSNNINATASPIGVGIMTATEPNDTIGEAFNTGVTLQPGMSLSVTGALNNGSDPTDFMLFNTGNANTVTFTATWSSSASVTLNVENPSGTVLGTQSATSSTSVSLTWTVDSGSSPRYINVVSGGPYPGTYSLIITAN